MRKSKLKLLISALVTIFIILIACIAIIFVGKRMMDNYKTQLNDMQTEMDANKQVVYVAKEDIEKGAKIEKDVNVYQQEIYTGLEPDNYISEETLSQNGVAIVDIAKNDPVMANMVTTLEVDDDTRDYEIAVANLMTDQKNNEYVDVRIMFPDGSDYLVLSKKLVHNLTLESCVFNAYMNEEEILRMASATIDAFTTTGARIYTTRYIEGNLQEKAIPNYPICSEAYDLTKGNGNVNADPNIVFEGDELEKMQETLNREARLDLQARLSGLTEDQLKAVADGHGIEDTAKNSVLMNRTYDADGVTISENEVSDNEASSNDIGVDNTETDSTEITATRSGTTNVE